MATSLQSFKIQGQTAADVAVATVAVSRWSDGSWRFTSASTTWRYNGDDQAVNRLLFTLFTGTDGLTGAKTPLFGTGLVTLT